jgi:hypothetical protein
MNQLLKSSHHHTFHQLHEGFEFQLKVQLFEFQLLSNAIFQLHSSKFQYPTSHFVEIIHDFKILHVHIIEVSLSNFIV